MTTYTKEPAAYIGEKQAHGWPTFHSPEYVRDYIKDKSKLTPLYTHPAPMSKADMVKVLGALKYHTAQTRPIASTDEAITIMQDFIRGMK